jgi:hypothetical protein
MRINSEFVSNEIDESELPTPGLIGTVCPTNSNAATPAATACWTV